MQFVTESEKEQEHTSAATSLNQAAAGLTHAVKRGFIKPNSLNVDYGGGAYDKGKSSVENAVPGAKLLIHDKYNRTAEHNSAVEQQATGNADYVGNHNVLNAIKEPEQRISALHKMKGLMKPKTGILHLTVHEGEGTGNARVTKNDNGRGSSWQNHRKTNTYMDEVRKVFPKETHTVTQETEGGNQSDKGKHIVVRQNQ